MVYTWYTMIPTIYLTGIRVPDEWQSCGSLRLADTVTQRSARRVGRGSGLCRPGCALAAAAAVGLSGVPTRRAVTITVVTWYSRVPSRSHKCVHTLAPMKILNETTHN
jgi:hypothetical protein